MVLYNQFPYPQAIYTILPVGTGGKSCIALASPESGYSSQSGSPATVLNNIFSQMNTTGRSGIIFVKAGDYYLGTATPAVTFLDGGFQLIGEGFGAYPTAPTAGAMQQTRFLAGANNQTLFQATAGRTGILQYWALKNFLLDSNGFTGLVGIDMTANESSTGGSIIDSVGLNAINNAGNANNGNFGTGFILDGNDDMHIINPQVRGSPTNQTVPTGFEFQINNPNGTIEITHPMILGPNSLSGKWQTCNILGGMGTIGNIQLSGNSTGDANPPNITNIDSVYWGNLNPFLNASHKFDVNGFASLQLAIRNSFIRQDNGKNIINLGAGTLDSLILENCQINQLTGQGGNPNFTDSIANCGRRRIIARNVKLNGTFGNNPFTVDANGFLADPGFTTTTPAVPASTGTQQNTNPYPVRIYFLTASAVTFTITDPAGTVSASITGSAGQEITLGPMAKITPTYTTLTWKWYGVNE